MRKTMFSLCVALISMAQLFAQDAKEIESKLDKVVLFPYEAQEYRISKVQLSQGKQEIKIAGLSPYIKKESVRVESDGNFNILNVNYELDYLNTTEKSKQTQDLEKKIKKTNFLVQDEETEIKILNEKVGYFQANQNMDSEVKVNPTDFKALSEYYMTQIADARQQLLVHQRKLKVHQDSLRAYQNQISTINSKQNEPSGFITLTLNAKLAQKGTLKFSYLVGNSNWEPSYDIRFQSINKPLELSYKASIEQTTGLDWVNIPMSLSTAQTQVSANIPDLRPYYLQYMRIQNKPKQISMQASTVNNYSASNSLSKRKYSAERAAPSTQVPSEQRTSFTFNIEGLQTIKSEGKENLIRYKDAEVPCSYIYKTIPKLSDKVYLIGRIENWFDLGIQNGKLNLYFENAFIGTSFINTEQFSDTLDVSFGVDQGIMVKREKIKEFTSSKILGSNKTDNIGWKIILRNNKNEAIKVKVLDQIPITKDDDFEVEIVNLSGGIQNETSGEVEWNISLAPKESKELSLQYTVEYPKAMRLITD